MDSTAGHPKGKSAKRAKASATARPGAACSDAGSGTGVRQIAATLRKLHAANERLQRQALLFDAAINNMNQGLCFFDGDQKLIVCNERYAELYRLSPDRIPPGTNLRDIVEQRFAAGSSPEDMTYADYLAWRDQVQIKLAASNSIVKLKDGRSIAIHHEPLPDSGWVATHEDVTDRLSVEASLVAQRERLGVALDNMRHGLSMFDSDQRLIVCNPRYIDMYKLSPDLGAAGSSLRDILARRIAMGTGAANLAEHEAPDLRVSSAPHTRRVPLTDGRTISVGYQLLPGGGGWVSTHEDVSDAIRAEAQIAHMAHHDGLTGLPNRLLFRSRLTESLAQLKRHGGQLAVLCLDLDRFKPVNDTFGHSIGDALLREVGSRLKDCVREEDTIARFGGDEFVVLQTAPSSSDAADSLARRLVECISAPFTLQGHDLTVGASVGIALAPDDGDAPDRIIGNADLALYRAKSEGRRSHRFFKPEMNERLMARRILEQDLRRAVVGGFLQLHYQPQINIRDNRISGFEALLRWNHPERGFIPPAEFIPLAEETGLIGALGEWVLRQACADAQTWPDDLTIAVNLSPVQFRRPGLVRSVASALAASGLDTRRLELEITETVLLAENDANLAMLGELRALGVRIALDDFGTGYSSLGYLRTFTFDKIKIDQTFIRELGTSLHSEAIVRAVIGLGRELNITITAEGVETVDRLDWLRHEGCDEIQGFLTGYPAPAVEAARLIERCNQIARVA